MARSVDEVLDGLRKRGFDPRLKGLRASFRFDIEQVGSYHVGVDDGVLSVNRSGDPADCVVRCNAEDFAHCADGELNMLTAAMRGQVHIEGDLALAKLLHGLLPAPSHGASQQEVHP